MNRTKRLRNKEFFLPDWLWTDPSACYSVFGLVLKHEIFLSHELADLCAGTYNIGSSPGSQALRLQLEIYHWLSWISVFSLTLQILDLVSFHIHVIQFFILNLFLYLHVLLVCSHGEFWLSCRFFQSCVKFSRIGC